MEYYISIYFIPLLMSTIWKKAAQPALLLRLQFSREIPVLTTHHITRNLVWPLNAK